MKKLLLASLFLFPFLISGAEGQDRRGVKGSSLTFSVGAGAMTQGEELFGWFGTDSHDYRGVHDLYHGPEGRYTGGMRTSGLFSLAYNYRINNWLEWKTGGTYTGFYQNSYYYDGDRKAENLSRHYIYVMTGLNAVWLSRGIVELYSGLEAGPGFIFTNDHTEEKVFAGGHVTFLGARIGRGKWFATMECGFGMRGIGSAGIGYRFNKKI